MTGSPEISGKISHPILSGLKLGLIWGFLFAFVESTNTLLSFVRWAHAEGMFPALRMELYSLLIHVPLVLALSLVISLIFLLAEKFKPDGAFTAYHEEIISGILAWVLAFMILETLARPAIVWDIYRQALVISGAALAAGAGVAAAMGWLKRRLSLRSGAFLLGILAISAFAFNHGMLAFFLKVKLRDYSLILAVTLFALSGMIIFLLGFRWLRSRKKALKYLWSAVCLLAFLSPLAAHEPGPSESIEGPAPTNPVNIIVIISDTCRADAIGAYGGNNSTPNIDRMAREGIIFERAFAQAPWTMPSMVAAVSSRYPSVLKQGRLFKAPESITTLTEALHSGGYHTKLLMGNYSLHRSSGFTQGFDEYEVFNEFHRLQGVLPLRMYYKMDNLYRRARDKSILTDLTELISAKAKAFIGCNDIEQPFFLWAHFMDPHTPYSPPERYIGKKFRTQIPLPFVPKNPWHIKGNFADPQEDDIRTGMLHLTREDKEFLRYLYDAEVRYIDEKVGEILNKLREAGLDKNTLVVFTSDHGEEFWEHGDFGHGQSLHAELLHIPLIMWGAGLKPGRVEEQVQLIDLAPSLLEFAGLPAPGGFQGKSFLGIPKGDDSGTQKVFAEGTWFFEEMKSIQDGSHKLIWRQESKRYELYETGVDESEAHDIFDSGHPAFKALEMELWPWADENIRLREEVSGRGLPPAQREELESRLKALGYLK